MKAAIGARVIELTRGDITHETTDAIVNAANSSLLGGGGVDGAIHRAGGPEILEACKQLRASTGTCPPGHAVITNAGRLACRYVIHAVGPVWHGGARGEAELLASAYRSSLRLADEHGLRSLAFPSISTGAYGYPEPAAADVALRTVRDHLMGETSITQVRFVLFAETTLATYRTALSALACGGPESGPRAS